MPIEVDVPDLGVVEFPDGMSDADISSAIQSRLSAPKQQTPEFPVDQTVKLDPYEQAKYAQSEQENRVPEGPKPISETVKLSPYEQAQYEFSSGKGPRPQTGLETTTEFTEAGAKGIESGLEAISKPIAEIAAKFSPAQIERLVQMGSPSMTAAIARQRMIGGGPQEAETLKNIVPPEERRTIGTGVGVANAISDQLNFFASPLGISTLGIGALPKAAQTAVSAAFAIHMASQTPELARELGEELGKNPQDQDPEKIAYLTTSAMAHMGWTTLGSAHALNKLGATPGLEILFDRSGPSGSVLEQSGRQIAWELTDPRMSQLVANRIPQSPSALVTRTGGLFPEVPEVTAARREAEAMTPEGLAEADRQRKLRTFQQQLDQIKPPKVEVPFEPEAEWMDLTKEIAGTPLEKPAAKELATFDDFASDLRAKGRPDMTIREVQELYPSIFRGYANREGARALLNEAFGKKPKAPAQEPMQEVPSAVNFLSEKVFNPDAKISNRDSIAVGQSLRGVEDLDNLVSIFDRLTNEIEAFKKTSGEDRIAGLEKGVALASKRQIVKEAIDVATNSGSWIEGEGSTKIGDRPLDWRKNPEVEAWLRKNASKLGIEVPILLPDAEKVSSGGLPEVPEGFVRVFHAEGGAEGAGYGGGFFSESHKYVAPFGQTQSYIDLPKAVYDKLKAEAKARGQVNGIDLGKYPELIKRAKPIEKPLAPEVFDTDFFTKEPAATVPSVLEFPPQEIPSSEIATRADLMQFRQGAKETGETASGKIQGKWDELKAGLLLLWEPKDPAAYGLKEGQKYIVANGHHRFAFGQEKNVPAHAAQVIREADGYSARDARRIAAEVNISDDKGTIHDQVKYLRNAEGTRSPDEELGARERVGAKGKRAATIAFDASDDVYTSFINERITPEQAEAIANGAPKNAKAQAVGLAAVERVKDPQSLQSLVERYMDEKPVVTGETMDMFRDDSAVKKMEADELKANKFREEIKDRINSMRGASKRVDIAKEEGIDIKDPQAIEKRLAFLRGELDRWRQWWKHDDLKAKISGEPVKVTVPPVIPPVPAPEPIVKPPTPAPGGAEPPSPAQEPIPAPVPEKAPAPQPGEVPPTPPAPTPAPAPQQQFKPTGFFGQDKKEKAKEFLRKKLEKKQASDELVIRPQLEKEERFQAAAEGQPELFAGEREDVTPLFEQSTLSALTDVAGSLIEEGKIAFPIWREAMVAEVGTDFNHYLRRAYNQVRDVDTIDPNLKKLMTPREEVELYDDNGVKVGKGAGKRPGLIVVEEDKIPQVEQYVNPNTFVGPEGDSIDWTQSKSVNLTLAARESGKGGMMIADGPGVGKSGTGAMAAHFLTFEKRVKLEDFMRQIWDDASPEARAKWFLSRARGGEVPAEKKTLGERTQEEADRIQASEEGFSAKQLDAMAKLKWDNVRPEQRLKIYRNYGFSQKQISENNANADKPRGKVLIVGVNKQQIETSFKPDFEKFGISQDNIDFITYNDLSNPGAEGSPQRARFDKMMNTDWNAVIFDEAQALKNAGSGREHNSRKLKTPFKVFMTATPMDNVPNAIYFFSEITGKTKFQIMDQLGLQRIVKTIGGEDREFVVQKPGISSEDVKQQILKLRNEAISQGTMIRREFPWWGDVIGREREVSLYTDMKLRWEAADAAQKADWTMPQTWDALSPEERARLLLPSIPEEAGAVPKESPFADRFQASGREFTPSELERMKNMQWDNLRPEQKAKVFRGNLNFDKPWEQLSDDYRDKIYRNADYTPQEIESGIRVKKGNKGPYWLERLTDTEAAEQQQIFNKWQEAIDKSRNMMVRRNLAGQREQELKRWAEQIKAQRSIAIILKELEAGRNVVVYGNTVNDHYVKGLGESIWREAGRGSDVPNSDWVKFRGGVGLIESELKRMNIPFSQIFGPVKDVKTHGIREFYSNRNRVALVTTKSGGAGLNLDDVVGRHPRTIIITDIDWPGDMFEQVMYRVSRRNTASESKAHILLIPNAISDSKIIDKMNKKLSVLRGIQSGKDTDLMAFLDDLNNPENTKVPNNPVVGLDPVSESMPKMEWEEVRGRTGKIRWKTIGNEAFMKWYWENGGDEKPPLGIRRILKNHKQEIWSEHDPKKFGQQEPDELQESSDPAYPNQEPAKYSGTPYETLVSDIDRLEKTIKKGIDVQENTSLLNEMTSELERRRELDERTDILLADNPEYQDLMRKMSEMPDHPHYPEWELRRSQLTAEAADEVGGTIPEPQAATTGPTVVPPSVIPPSLTRTPKSMDDIARKLRKGIGVPIRYKSWLGGGFYDTLLNYFRVKRVGDYPAMFHEAGHALDAEFQLWKEPTLTSELAHLGDYARPGSRSSWRPGRSVKYRLGEGVAEFVRYWIFDPAEAKRMAPNMYKFWENMIDANEKRLGFMRAIQKDVDVFQKSPLEAQFQSKIVQTNPKQPALTIGSLISNVFDELHFIRLASDDAFRFSKGAVKPSEDPYILYRLLRGNYGRADAFLKYGVIDANTGDVKLGSSLVDALKGVRGHIQEFTRYIAALQAQEMHRQGKESGFTNDQIREVLKNHGNKPEFIDAFKKLQDWQDSLLRYGMDMGLFSTRDYLRMKAENTMYIPMRRLYEVGVSEPQISGGSGIGSQKGRVGKPASLKSRKGSDRPLIDPLQSMVENAYFITFAAEKQRALVALADLSRFPNMGKWINPYETQPKEKVQFQAGRIKKLLEDNGVNVSNLSDDTLLWFWRNAKNPVLRDNIIRVKRGDSFEYYQLQPDLFKAVMSMDKFSFDRFMRVLAFPSQVLRAGVTLEPTFTIRNIIRDTISSAVISKYTMVPFEAAMQGVIAQIPPSFYKFFGAKNPQEFTTRLLAEWRASGGEHSVESAYFDRDKLKEYMQRQITNDQTWKDKGLFIVKHPLTALQALTQFGEQSTRIGEYRKAYNALLKEGWSRKDAHIQAAFESRDLQDFAMGGGSSTIKSLKYLTAFWNAGLQGRYKFFRSLSDSRNPDAWKQVFMKGFGWITVAKLMEQAINWDDENYWNQPRWQRMLFFHFQVKRGDPNHKFILVPVPFEAGIIFATLPGSILETIKQKNVNAATAFGKMFTGQIVDNPIPQPLLTALELKASELGYDFYQNRSILPKGMENEPYWARATDTSSTLARKAGKILNVAPGKIEHAIRRTTGGLGSAMTHHFIDPLLADEKNQGAPRPFVSTRMLITEEPGMRSQIIDDFYKKLDVLKQENVSREKYGEIDREINLSEYRGMLAAEKQMADLRKRIRGTRDREMRVRVSQQIEKIAKQYVRNQDGTYKGYEVKQ